MPNTQKQVQMRLFVIRAWPVIMVVMALALAATAMAARSAPNAAFPTIHIENFGKMNEKFFRGAQPKEEDFNDLAALGIKTIINLRKDPTRYEKRAVEALGMRYVHIPMSARRYPKNEQVEYFLQLATDPNTGPFYVHCVGGRHRTGLMGAVYRMKIDGWNYERTYKEMKDYDFYTRWGHGPIRDYVQDYWRRIQVGWIPVQTRPLSLRTGS